MLEILIFIGICFGFSNQMVYSSGPGGLYDKIKVLSYKISPSLYEGMKCMICLPTWIGMILSLLCLFVLPLQITPSTLLFSEELINLPTINLIICYILIVLFDGFIASGITYLINTIQLYFEKNTPIEIGEEDNE